MRVFCSVWTRSGPASTIQPVTGYPQGVTVIPVKLLLCIFKQVYASGDRRFHVWWTLEGLMRVFCNVWTRSGPDTTIQRVTGYPQGVTVIPVKLL
jgi:hypothetical protein